MTPTSIPGSSLPDFMTIGMIPIPATDSWSLRTATRHEDGSPSPPLREPAAPPPPRGRLPVRRPGRRAGRAQPGGEQGLRVDHHGPGRAGHHVLEVDVGGLEQVEDPGEPPD